VADVKYTNLDSWPAPAKLNLFLHILGRRAAGYHELQTCFQFIDADLCIRAARALKEAAGCSLGADISLTKRIPIGGGLGGGSSDAATCLVALNHLWRLHWPIPKLAALGLKLGADVPVFVHGRTSWAEGVGEQLTPLYGRLAPPETNYLILKPKVFVGTAHVFQDPELTRNSPPITIHGFLASGGRNDCLGVVRRRYPEVAHALDWLSVYGVARLTGTGACVFLACETLDLGQEIMRKLPPTFDAYLIRGLNDSPLLERLATMRLVS
jgi:4-diphosphocytidyl-2-C-methyl-D-erythritol kinase